MRDLYERLGLGFGADDAAIAAAVRASRDAELQRRVEGVLRVASRRAAHDQVYRAARQLRDWRVELHLEDGAWAQALADSDLVRPDLPTEPLRLVLVDPATKPWWKRLLRL